MQRVLAVGKSQNALNLVDPSTGAIARIALGGDPNSVGVEQHNHWAYVGEKDDQIIPLIDLIDRTLSGNFTIPRKIGSPLFDQQGALLFVSQPRRQTPEARSESSQPDQQSRCDQDLQGRCRQRQRRHQRSGIPCISMRVTDGSRFSTKLNTESTVTVRIRSDQRNWLG